MLMLPVLTENIFQNFAMSRIKLSIATMPFIAGTYS